MKNKKGISNTLIGVLAMTAGAVAGKMADRLLGGLTQNTMIQGGVKIAIGMSPEFMGVKNDLLKKAGQGMAVQGAYGIVSGYLPAIAGNAGTGLYGIGASYDDTPYLMGVDKEEVIGQMSQDDVIGSIYSHSEEQM